jgi:hypothetical protein
MSVGRLYVCSFDEVAVTAQQDLFDIAPADDKVVVIHELVLTQSTETAEAQEEWLHLRFVRGFATVGSGGSAGTIVALNSDDPAAGATVRTNDTTKAVVGAGTTDVVRSDAFQVRSGYYYLPTPETRIVIKQPNTRLVIQLNTTPADSVTMSGSLIWAEL